MMMMIDDDHEDDDDDDDDGGGDGDDYDNENVKIAREKLCVFQWDLGHFTCIFSAVRP